MLHHADDLIFVDHFVANEVSRESRILDRLSKTRKNAKSIRKKEKAAASRSIVRRSSLECKLHFRSYVNVKARGSQIGPRIEEQNRKWLIRNGEKKTYTHIDRPLDSPHLHF